jgi:hypothetical protein
MSFVKKTKFGAKIYLRYMNTHKHKHTHTLVIFFVIETIFFLKIALNHGKNQYMYNRKHIFFALK